MNALYIGQVPFKPLTVTVTDDTGAPLDLTPYDGVEVTMSNPLGHPVDLTGGTVDLTGAAAGVVAYEFGTLSPFASPGDYTVQVRLSTTGGALDFTSTDTIEVYRPVEVAP